MRNEMNHDELSLDNHTTNNIIGTTFNLTNIKLLEKPIEIVDDDKSYTLLKIICDKHLKIFLKKIESIFVNNNKDITVTFNYDLNNNIDYYELLLNKKISQIIDNFDIKEHYNIKVSLVDEMLLWKLRSIEIADYFRIDNSLENDIHVDNFDPDYDAINLSMQIDCKKILKILNNEMLLLENQKNSLEKLLDELQNKFNINKIENYSEQINSLNLVSNK